MPKINVYLPDELARAVKQADLPVSAICQRALERAVSHMSAVEQAASSWSMDRFTQRARKAVELAERQAVDRGHRYVGTEHLLLGILDEGGNVGCKALVALDSSPDQVRAAVEAVIAGEGKGGAAEPSYTPRATRALELALRQSLGWGHNYVGCEHLLIGLAEEQEGLAAGALRRAGADTRNLRQVILEILSGLALPIAQPPEPQGDEQPAAPAGGDDVAATLQQILRRLDAIEERLAG